MVLDANTGKTIADIPGQKRNHGVALVPSAGRGFITDGEDASVTVFDLTPTASSTTRPVARSWSSAGTPE
jgi:hypothetical protein